PRRRRALLARRVGRGPLVVYGRQVHRVTHPHGRGRGSASPYPARPSRRAPLPFAADHVLSLHGILRPERPRPMKPMRLISGFLTVGFLTLMSRIAGLVRDILMTRFLGDGPVAEAFIVAQSLPNMFRRFFAEGAFNMAFIPMFAKKSEAAEDAEGFARDAFWGMAALLAVFSVLAMLAMPLLVLLMASGFAGDERFDLAVTLGRIAFP